MGGIGLITPLMRQLTKIKHISLRFTISLESDIGNYKFILKDRKDVSLSIFEDEIFNKALIDAHRHFIKTMKEDRVGHKQIKKLNQPIYH